MPPVLGGVRRRREEHRDHAEVAVRRGGGGDRGDLYRVLRADPEEQGTGSPLQLQIREISA